MTAGFYDCTQSILTRLADNWQTTPIIYDDESFQPDTNTSFIYVAVDFRDSNKLSLGSPSSYTALYEHVGNIRIDIMTPADKGIGIGLQYADTISSVFRSETFNNVVCLEPALDYRGQTKFNKGNWWITQLNCLFKYRVTY